MRKSRKPNLNALVRTLGYKSCLVCATPIKLRITRDLVRKKYCSKACVGKATVAKMPAEILKKNAERFKSKEFREHQLKFILRGIEHPRYIKDRSKLKAKRPPFENKQWTKQVFERDNYTCQFCKKRGGKLQADHIKPYSKFPEIRWDLDNGRTLCIPCHKTTDTYAGKARTYLRRMQNAESK